MSTTSSSSYDDGCSRSVRLPIHSLSLSYFIPFVCHSAFLFIFLESTWYAVLPICSSFSIQYLACLSVCFLNHFAKFVSTYSSRYACFSHSLSICLHSFCPSYLYCLIFCPRLYNCTLLVYPTISAYLSFNLQYTFTYHFVFSLSFYLCANVHFCTAIYQVYLFLVSVRQSLLYHIRLPILQKLMYFSFFIPLSMYVYQSQRQIYLSVAKVNEILPQPVTSQWNKKQPNFSKRCPKSSHSYFFLHSDILKCPRSQHLFGLILKEILTPRGFKIAQSSHTALNISFLYSFLCLTRECFMHSTSSSVFPFHVRQNYFLCTKRTRPFFAKSGHTAREA